MAILSGRGGGQEPAACFRTRDELSSIREAAPYLGVFSSSAPDGVFANGY
ncbi:hypothetical protein NBH00_07820 [Paraconexibacter antarcticus]|uniref:Uncharacterized protein n=1 Tax=Paraconexibacter antarcticus TaxID=2949664 RepID=A0ABY5DZQ7_9ACTN|nr:hypothetical protein [Paraconexibacter antarcticus]UTI66102.1 hypothetical protein NBH00_07820 [Paraconexibacter antarcticus]